ncbi:YwqG family protein [Alkalihalobacillus sp. AL-G]|uniref:YwqG family protein n=1 Tax=Alkalihalobacillus sp. AL-G TaxID=2926399 RepID=UPI00272DC78B|nr:YwqG family protein [Alkalihalobacillus sp. AL-G]WLD92876.1 YwqG family protein [Alkalihalobacillus sp. AL-G]
MKESKLPYLNLPNELECYRKQITKTIKPYIRISTHKNNTNLFQSKFSGNPYLPKYTEHPKDKNGLPMKLLAQINFEEIPNIESMPEKGILQLFISGEDDLMGINFDDLTDQSNFKVIYHSNIIEDKSLLVTDFSYMDSLNEEFFPIQDELSLSFTLEYEPISVEDYRNSDLLGESVDLSVEKDNGDKELWEVYSDTFLGDGHKMGGYPYFTQTDPRDYEKRYQEHNVLLLQIDTEDDKGIMWGDAGIANLFIKEEDLKALNFKNVIYNWDCH